MRFSLIKGCVINFVATSAARHFSCMFFSLKLKEFSFITTLHNHNLLLAILS